jgi:hypothetical protein
MSAAEALAHNVLAASGFGRDDERTTHQPLSDRVTSAHDISARYVLSTDFSAAHARSPMPARFVYGRALPYTSDRLMRQYQELLKHVLAHGTKHEDRPSVGTVSCFGYQTRYDLREGFPIVTTKLVPPPLDSRGVVPVPLGRHERGDLARARRRHPEGVGRPRPAFLPAKNAYA